MCSISNIIENRYEVEFKRDCGKITQLSQELLQSAENIYNDMYDYDNKDFKSFGNTLLKICDECKILKEKYPECIDENHLVILENIADNIEERYTCKANFEQIIAQVYRGVKRFNHDLTNEIRFTPGMFKGAMQFLVWDIYIQ